jgi:hypothetical protein
LIREAGIEEDLKNIKTTTNSLKNVGNFSVPIDPITVNLSTEDGEGKANKILPEQPEGDQPESSVSSTTEASPSDESENNNDETPETTEN